VALPRLTRNCARAQVWKAKCKPLEDEIVAIKILDLERQDPGKLVRPPSFVLWELCLQSPNDPSALATAAARGGVHACLAVAARLLIPRPNLQEEIRKEAHTMSMLNHPNLVSCYCSFVSGPVCLCRRYVDCCCTHS
jgi:hypothetical protein